MRYSTLGEPNELDITQDLLVRELIGKWIGIVLVPICGTCSSLNVDFLVVDTTGRMLPRLIHVSKVERQKNEFVCIHVKVLCNFLLD